MLDPMAARRSAAGTDAITAAALAHAAGAVARLDHAASTHPLLPALLHRARLDAVRRQAAVDGHAIDPWHLAAVLEGLRLRMDGALRIVDRGAVFEAARVALRLHGWLVAPDFDQEAEVRAATAALREAAAGSTPLLGAARWLHSWLDAGNPRAPARPALVRFWQESGVLRAPLPLTGARALVGETDWHPERWPAVFLHAVAAEANAMLALLGELEQAWAAARAAVAVGRRRTSRALAAVNLLATTPVLSAITLGAGLGMASRNAGALLEDLRTESVVVEVTHRSRRRLYGLRGLAPLRDGVAPPPRPVPGRGRGRPTAMPEEVAEASPPPLPAVACPAPADRGTFDFSGLEEAIAAANATIARTRQALEAFSDR